MKCHSLLRAGRPTSIPTPTTPRWRTSWSQGGRCVLSSQPRPRFIGRRQMRSIDLDLLEERRPADEQIFASTAIVAGVDVVEHEVLVHSYISSGNFRHDCWSYRLRQDPTETPLAQQDPIGSPIAQQDPRETAVPPQVPFVKLVCLTTLLLQPVALITLLATQLFMIQAKSNATTRTFCKTC
ncbi:uncharacterized protein LOC125551320 isoform X2 [Triticum urartu]|uniref:uncharacterized protein LOC125551320 isoform X2 n=1 Tax=Triticum urartu TaxID=4572 RepID=UPI002043B51B|nr:uncharacterized protein LOC125551320 isoform X2 [Triticum urartu]